MGKRKGRVAIIAIQAVLAIGAAGILAYYIYMDHAENKFTLGGNTTTIEEECPEPDPVKPGDSFPKDVKIENKGPNDCYVRVKALCTNSDIQEYLSYDLDEENWAYDSFTGYYYYKQVLKDGETSPSLFTTVTISKDIPEDILTDFDIIVYSESYQSEGFDNYEDAWAHFLENRTPLKKEVVES